MIIHRISQGIKDQDWFVVVVEVMIVVVGIFIGLQVDDWNERRQEQQRLNYQLEVLADELEGNERRLLTYENRLNDIISDMVLFRKAFAGEIVISHEDLERLIYATLPVPSIDIRQDSLEIIMGSEIFRGESYSLLKSKLQDWSASIVLLKRQNADAVNFRDAMLGSFFLNEIPLHIIEKQFQALEDDLLKSKFTLEIDKILSNQTMENVAVIRLTMTESNRQTLEPLLKLTSDLVSEVRQLLKNDNNA